MYVCPTNPDIVLRQARCSPNEAEEPPLPGSARRGGSVNARRSLPCLSIPLRTIILDSGVLSGRRCTDCFEVATRRRWRIRHLGEEIDHAKPSNPGGGNSRPRRGAFSGTWILAQSAEHA